MMAIISVPWSYKVSPIFSRYFLNYRKYMKMVKTFKTGRENAINIE